MIVGSIPTRSGNLAKRFVDITCNASRIRRKLEKRSVRMGAECLATRFPESLCLTCYVRDTACQKKPN